MTLRLKLGISVGANEFAASWAGHYWETRLPAGPTSDAIRDATSELKRFVGPKSHASLSVAILPPLVRLRRLVLPRLSANDLRLALVTNARQYFIGVGETPICGAITLSAKPRATPLVLAFAANAAAIESIRIGLESEGWRIDRIVPAHFAWTSAIVRDHPRLAKRTTRIGVGLDGEMNVLELNEGSLVRVRRHRSSAASASLESAPAQYMIGNQASETPGVVAAAGARLARRFQIVPDAARGARLARDRKVAIVLAALSCVNLGAAATVYRWRLEQKLDEIASQRSAIRPRALNALALRDSTQALADRTKSIGQLEESASRWSAVLSRIVLALPGDADLASIRASGDSIALEGQSPEASQVVATLQRTPGVETTKMASPVVRETTNGVNAERWRLALRIDHHAAVRQR